MSFLVLEAITPWVMEFARCLSKHSGTTTLQHVDWRAAKALRIQNGTDEGDLRVKNRIFPPGFAGQLSYPFTPMIRSGIQAEAAKLKAKHGEDVRIICPYPYTARWVRRLPGVEVIYLNLDDYEQYTPNKAQSIRALENELIQTAALTVCLGIHQTEKFRDLHREHAERIQHWPLGVVEEYLNPDLEQTPKLNTVGYVGNLSDRVDWAFVEEAVSLAPELTFEFIGHANLEDDRNWARKRSAVFDKANVRYLGPVPQHEVPKYYWANAVNWMPYDTKHPFNIASSPTKIFDAIASARPFVSTKIPEVLLYPDQIELIDTPAGACEALRKHAQQYDQAHAQMLRDFAAKHTWPKRTEQFLNLLSS